MLHTFRRPPTTDTDISNDNSPSLEPRWADLTGTGRGWDTPNVEPVTETLKRMKFRPLPPHLANFWNICWCSKVNCRFCRATEKCDHREDDCLYCMPCACKCCKITDPKKKSVPPPEVGSRDDCRVDKSCTRVKRGQTATHDM